MRRIDYAGSVHDEQEIAACLEVLRGGATALRIGKNVRAFVECRGSRVAHHPAALAEAHRAPADGLPNADRIMQTGLVLPCNHAMGDGDVDYVGETIDAFLCGKQHAD